MTAEAQASYLAELFEAGLLIPTGVQGVYGHSGAFEKVLDRFDALITRWGGGDGAEVMRFPPALTRQHFEESDYLRSFPQLAGTVHAFQGDDREYRSLLQALDKGEDWTTSQKPTQIVMTPAACYPIYPTLAQRGPLPKDGALVDVFSYCFRHEPSDDPARLQLFRQREYVRIGSPEQVIEFRDRWLERGQQMMASLQVPLKVDLASDAFFGRTGKMLAANQLDQALKFELLVPITSEEKPTACLSFNYHQDKFGQAWGIRTHDGEVAHTACVGFGFERTALALFRHHGFDYSAWPLVVREILSD